MGLEGNKMTILVASIKGEWINDIDSVFNKWHSIILLNFQILGPDVADEEYIAFVSDQDAYAYSGQKCSAQSALFLHKNWVEAGFIARLKDLAERRSMADVTIGPVLTVTNERCPFKLNHDSMGILCKSSS